MHKMIHHFLAKANNGKYILSFLFYPIYSFILFFYIIFQAVQVYFFVEVTLTIDCCSFILVYVYIFIFQDSILIIL